jgi:hypothetical protein
MKGFKKKRDVISSRERLIARSIALKVKKARPISVWEVLIPIIFIISFMKSRTDRDIFADNLLFTKNLALNAAYDMLQKQKTRESVMDRIKSQTGDLLATIPDNIYSDNIRQEQLKEIDLLVDHYYRLLQAEGSDYDDLVRHAYGHRTDFTTFTDRLKNAEKAVARAARQTLGAKADTAMATRIEDAADLARKAETDRIFGTSGR